MTYRITWTEFSHAPTEEWDRERFTEDAGFDRYDQQAIDALAVGQSVTLDNSVRITRLRSRTVIVQEWLQGMASEDRRALSDRAWAATMWAGRQA